MTTDHSGPRELLAGVAGGLSDRKHRLLAAAVYRWIRGLFVDTYTRRVLDVIEAAADGHATADDLRAARLAAVSDWEAFEFTTALSGSRPTPSGWPPANRPQRSHRTLCTLRFSP